MSTNNIQSKKSTQPEKTRLGAVGENMVVSMLMQHGWDAFNANCTIKNYKSIDIVCLNSEINPNRSLEKVSCHFLMTAIRKIALYMLDS